MELVGFVETGNKLLSYLFGKYDESFFFLFLLIFIISYLIILGFIVMKKPSFLKEWKIPHMVNLGITAVLGILSYILSYLVVNAMYFLQLINKEVNAVKPNQIVTLFFTSIILILGLTFASGKKKKEDNDLVPKALQSLIYPFIILILVLLFLVFSELTILSTISKDPALIVNYGAKDPVLLAILLLVFAVVTFLLGFYPKKFQRFSKKIDESLKKFLEGIKKKIRKNQKLNLNNSLPSVLQR